MNIKIREKIGELLQSEENMREYSAAIGDRRPEVTLKDEQGREVKVQLQRRPALFSSR